VTRTIVALVAVLSCHCGHASIDADCTMDSRGNGRCDLTNAGTRAGAHCFHVRVTNKLGLHPPASTSVFCSGRLEPKTTRRVPFAVADVRHLCSPSDAGLDEIGSEAWNQYCDFAILEDLPTLPKP
jgi:hypothetical protein